MEPVASIKGCEVSSTNQVNVQVAIRVAVLLAVERRAPHWPERWRAVAALQVVQWAVPLEWSLQGGLGYLEPFRVPRARQALRHQPGLVPQAAPS